jgi:hypothetical protein
MVVEVLLETFLNNELHNNPIAGYNMQPSLLSFLSASGYNGMRRNGLVVTLVTSPRLCTKQPVVPCVEAILALPLTSPIHGFGWT